MPRSRHADDKVTRWLARILRARCSCPGRRRLGMPTPEGALQGKSPQGFLTARRLPFPLRPLKPDDDGAEHGIADAQILVLAIFAPSVSSPVKSGCGELKDRFFVHRLSRQVSTQPAFTHHDDPVTQRQ